MTMKTANVNVRVDPAIKKKVNSILERLGISESGAINMFYNQIILNNGIPFSLTIPPAVLNADKLTAEEMDEALETGYQEYLEGKGKPADEVFGELRKEFIQ